MNENLPKGSVRSLPKGKLKEFQRFFDEVGRNNETENSDENISSAMASNGSPIKRWKEPLKPPGKPGPVISDTGTEPSLPTPSPRNSIKKNGAVKVVTGNTTEGTGDHVSTNQVSEVLGRFEQKQDVNSVNKLVLKVPIRPQDCSQRQHSLSPQRQKSPNASPLLERRGKGRDDGHVYSHIWPKDDGFSLDGAEKQRPVTVSEKSKIFEQLSKNPKPSPKKPLKPPPPNRQRSSSDASPQDIQSALKARPPRPTVRQRSLVERESPKLRVEDEKTQCVSNPSRPVKKPAPPPSKPPRTGAHDDYMYVKVKLEKEAAEKRVLLEGDQNVSDQNETLGVVSDQDTNKHSEKNVNSANKRPMRPPPPNRRAPRPFSIATDSFVDFKSKGSDDSVNSFEDLQTSLERENTPFYESITEFEVDNSASNDMIKHWDLPLSSHPEPIRRSRSAECIQKAVDDKGKKVYIIIIYIIIQYLIQLNFIKTK